MHLGHIAGVCVQMIRQRVAQRLPVSFGVQTRIQRFGRLCEGQQVGHAHRVAAQQRGNVLGAHAVGPQWLQAGVAFKLAFGAQHLLQFTHHVHRQAHRAALVDQGAFNRLANPPGSVS